MFKLALALCVTLTSSVGFGCEKELNAYLATKLLAGIAQPYSDRRLYIGEIPRTLDTLEALQSRLEAEHAGLDPRLLDRMQERLDELFDIARSEDMDAEDIFAIALTPEELNLFRTHLTKNNTEHPTIDSARQQYKREIKFYLLIPFIIMLMCLNSMLTARTLDAVFFTAFGTMMFGSVVLRSMREFLKTYSEWWAGFFPNREPYTSFSRAIFGPEDQAGLWTFDKTLILKPGSFDRSSKHPLQSLLRYLTLVDPASNRVATDHPFTSLRVPEKASSLALTFDIFRFANEGMYVVLRFKAHPSK